VIASLVYVAVIVPDDFWLHANYGFVGNPPSIPPLVNALGPWPQRAIILVGLVPLGFVIVLVPWLLARRFMQRAKTHRLVMPALVAGIHVLKPIQSKTWMAGTSPAMTS
jgi:uncharacterized membrane protein YwaF